MKKIIYILLFLLLLSPQIAIAFSGESLYINFPDAGNSAIVKLLGCADTDTTGDIVISEEDCSWVEEDLFKYGFDRIELSRDRVGDCRVWLNGRCQERWPTSRYSQRYDIPDKLRLSWKDIETGTKVISKPIERKYINEYWDVTIEDDKLTIGQTSNRMTPSQINYGLMYWALMLIMKVGILWLLLDWSKRRASKTREGIETEAKWRKSDKIKAILALVASGALYVFVSLLILPLLIPQNIYFWACMLGMIGLDFLALNVLGFEWKKAAKLTLSLGVITLVVLNLPYQIIRQIVFWR